MNNTGRQEIPSCDVVKTVSHRDICLTLNADERICQTKSRYLIRIIQKAVRIS